MNSTTVARPGTSVREYYAHESVRQRIRESCGLRDGADDRAIFLGARGAPGHGPERWEDAGFHAPAELDSLLDAGLDVTRSLWADRALLFYLDLDYWNADRPDEAFTHPVETFFKLEPVHRAIQRLLRDRGLPALDVMTGQGYHYVGRIPHGHPVLHALASLCPEPPSWFPTHARRAPAWAERAMEDREARAYVGLGMLMEHVAQEILRRTSARCAIPVVLDAVVVGAGPVGRECISLDLSAFTDPLDIRHARVAFSTYQSHMDPLEHAPARLAPLAAIPRGTLPLLRALTVRRDLAWAAEHAERTVTTLPDVSAGVARMLRDYERSPLRRFHQRFHEEPWDPARSRDDRRQLEREGLPACIHASLSTPNDLLLRPGHLQNLARYLWTRGWPPRRIAALVAGLYEEDHGWGDRWHRMEPRTRAEVYVRAFTGMIAVGLDRMLDFNCRSTQEKGMCPGGICGHELQRDRDRWTGRSR